MGARRLTRVVWVSGVAIGGNHPISVQSMTKTDTRDVAATSDEIAHLAAAGADLVRLAVPDSQAAEALPELVRRSTVPLVADIHFDYTLALAALTAGVAKLRINPGNIGGRDRVRAVVTAARERGVPIRIGVNAGSLEKGLLAKYGGVTAEGMVESALSHLRILEDLDFADTVVSLKASGVSLTLAAYRLAATTFTYPLHLGVTEAGTVWSGTIRSAVGLGSLLAEGIGDTLRVSLTGPGEDEIAVGREILRSLELGPPGPNLISCPTCGRTEVDIRAVAEEIERRLQRLAKPLRVAVMGCAVNGPGEAREADVGLAGGRGYALLFRRGEIIGRVDASEMLERLWAEVERLATEGDQRKSLGEELDES